MMRALVLLLLFTNATACGTVAPYERGRLVQRTMQNKSPLDANFDLHVAEVRESATGASSGETASCGCR